MAAKATATQTSSGGLILVINAGSSSLKLALVPVSGQGGALRAQVEGIGQNPAALLRDAQGDSLPVATLTPEQGRTHDAALGFLLEEIRERIDLGRVIATAHRIVHGGAMFAEPVAVDDAIESRIASLADLAPLHQPHNLAGLRAARALLPALPHVACFDTAFHATIPESRYTYPLPLALRERGIRRFGFHGLSYAYIASVLPKHLAEARRAHVVVAHLGNGCSLCALKHGASFDTTMGMTPLDGLMMGTRSGTIDPSVLLHLIRREGMSAEAAENLLFRVSGLLGVSGDSNDMRTLLASDRPEAALAVELFISSVARGIAGMAASLGGLDAVVFTGGIGERAATIRADIVNRLAFAGLRLDAAANAQNARKISTRGSRVRILVLPTDEERMIASQALGVIGPRGPSSPAAP